MAETKPLSPGVTGFTAAADFASGFFQGVAAHEQRKAAFAIQKAQANINDMVAEQNFKIGMEALLQNQAALRSEMSDAARAAAQTKATNQANMRVARAEGGGTNDLSEALMDQEAQHANFYQKLLIDLQTAEMQEQLQKGALMNDRFNASVQKELSTVDPGSGVLGALNEGLQGGLNTFFQLSQYTNWNK